MTEHSFVRCEAVKTAYRQTKEGMVVSFAIHPSEMPPELALAPVGTRVLLAVAELRDDATANEAPAPADAPPIIGARTSVEGTPDVPGRGHLVSEVPALGGDDTFPPPNAAVVAATAEGPGHKSEAARERYRTMDKMEQARVRAGRLALSPRFDAWIKDAYGTIRNPAQFIRDWCGVESRTEISSSAAAYERFRDLEFQINGHAEER